MFSLFGCKENDDLGLKGSEGQGDDALANGTPLVSFYYHYNGSIGGNDYTYSIEDNIFTYEAMDDPYDELKMDVDVSVLNKLKDLYLKYEVCRWDGFNMYSTDVLDGDGFSLDLGFEDGQTCSAHGSNAYPDGYHDFVKDMNEVLRPIVEEMKDKARNEAIESGISGKVSSIFIYFKQSGTSGSDSYTVHIYPTDNDSANNFSFDISSTSGEYYEKGEYHFYGHLDREYIDLSWVDELVEKYDLIQWYDYDKTAEDYANAEWFQLNISFDGEDDSKTTSLSAMGTEHPDNYEAFRDEFLRKMFEYYGQVEDKITR